MYAVVVAIVAVSIAVMYLLCERTNAGKAFHAIREDEILAQTLGINTTRYKLLAFGLSSGFAGLAGGLYAYYVQLVSPSVASAATTSLIIGMAVFGGLGTLWGPVLGALLLYGVYEGLRFVGVVYNLVLVGLVMMIFVIYFPRGLAGFGRSMTYRLGVDVGGTFTDLVLVSPDGLARTRKVLSTTATTPRRSSPARGS